ncbi:NUDIX domain-containing protein [Rhizobium sp. LC145]|jgi:ADP-ribose pyrophosphatase YjhB (NUDIX family)|uniref:NUDIX domain-containing protein n=1 Tax=Rhizobium sp. LC145 TaxID=1120688 RepID=UPI000629F6A6|nr:NUDIX domain-containing protein [Rhizobium sp. LC145]KKX33833.1 DNA mismatch repair protein MutT [Rhizobium sp. LC145]TKT60059.1 NUDIX domain-containing protein [Rhizobiaceae bacterium LC148]
MTIRPGIDFPGVGAGLVILRDDGKVLLYRRVKAPEAGHWNIVGGKVDHMEPSAEAARREAEEETGLAIGKLDFLCATEEIIGPDRQHWISMIYVTRDFRGEPSLTEPDKLSEMGWFDPRNPPQPLSVFSSKAFEHLQSQMA